MRFKKKPGQTNRHTRTSQIEHLTSPTTGSQTQGITLLQRVCNVKDNGQIAANFLHYAEAQHIDHQIVVAKARSTITQDKLIVTCLLEFLDNVQYLRGTQELRLLDIDYTPRFG